MEQVPVGNRTTQSSNEIPFLNTDVQPARLVLKNTLREAESNATFSQYFSSLCPLP